MSVAPRRIAHLDMDAFYASVELLRRPELRGRAVVIGGRRITAPQRPNGTVTQNPPRLGDYAGRGVVTTATYEARAHGIHSGMGLMKAARLAPDAILLPADFEAYRHYSNLFKAAVATLAPAIEDRGIDEIYIDITDIDGDTAMIAQSIKQVVRDATGLSCSIGVSPNKLLSKICSELDKPDGLTILSRADVPARIWPLEVRRINGIGPKAASRLAALGIGTIAELVRADLGLLQAHFGQSFATWLHRAAHGIDDRPIVTRSEPKSVSRETTFEHDLHPCHDRDRLNGIFTDLCVRVAADLTRKGYVGRTIGIKVRFQDFRTVTRDLSLGAPTADAATIRRAASQCLRRLTLDRRLRLLGVRVGSLSPQNDGGYPDPVADPVQLSLLPGESP
ncbi:DNA polymerase IV [Rhodocyclaceae bacterium SMB388]